MTTKRWEMAVARGCSAVAAAVGALQLCALCSCSRTASDAAPPGRSQPQSTIPSPSAPSVCDQRTSHSRPPPRLGSALALRSLVYFFINRALISPGQAHSCRPVNRQAAPVPQPQASFESAAVQGLPNAPRPCCPALHCAAPPCPEMCSASLSPCTRQAAMALQTDSCPVPAGCDSSSTVPGDSWHLRDVSWRRVLGRQDFGSLGSSLVAIAALAITQACLGGPRARPYMIGDATISYPNG